MGWTLYRGEVASGLCVDLGSGGFCLALVLCVGFCTSGHSLRQGDDELGPGHGSTSPAKPSQAVSAALYDARLAAPGRVASMTDLMQATDEGQAPGEAQAARAACESWPR